LEVLWYGFHATIFIINGGDAAVIRRVAAFDAGTQVRVLRLRVTRQVGVQLQQVQGRQLTSDVMSLRFDREGDFLALGCKNGTRILFNSA
jgi:uncharacterized lipoprotein YajG